MPACLYWWKHRSNRLLFLPKFQSNEYVLIWEQDLQEQLLKAIVGLLARQTFSVSDVLQIIGPDKETQFKAYNLCDGTRSQSDIAKACKLDKGSFSRTLSRWVDERIVIRLDENGEKTLLHVFPISETRRKAEAKKDSK